MRNYSENFLSDDISSNDNERVEKKKKRTSLN